MRGRCEVAHRRSREADNVQVNGNPPAALGDLPPGTYVRLAVIDRRKGVRADVAAHVFEPSFAKKAAKRGPSA